jgi:hypothetical protein
VCAVSAPHSSTQVVHSIADALAMAMKASRGVAGAIFALDQVDADEVALRIDPAEGAERAAVMRMRVGTCS